MREIGDIVREFECRRGELMALATLVRARGSSYRRPGARMLIMAEGRTVGSLSGGCLEEEVAGRGRAILRTGDTELMTFDTRRRFGCNGALEILVERADDNFLAELSASYHARQPCLISTTLEGGSRLVRDSEPIAAAFLQRIEPSPQLLVFGHGSDGDALCGMARILGWPARVHECASELDESYDAWTAAVVKTHNYGRDFAILRALFAHDLRYIGLMGPRTRRKQLIGDLLDTGVAPGPNLFAPAGIDLGASAPETIALAIVAEIQAVFGGGSGEFLRKRKAPIHAPREVAEIVLP